MAKLTPKQIAFADEYIINGGNATQAAIKAGYSEKTAGRIAGQNLKKLEIVNYIASKVRPIVEKREIDIQSQLNSLLDIYDGKVIESHSKQIDHLQGDVVVKDMTYEYTPDLENRLKAIDLFLKYASPLLQVQLEKAKADAELSRLKAESLKNGTTQTTEDKLDELLEKISGELND